MVGKQETMQSLGARLKAGLADGAGKVMPAGDVAVGGECAAFRSWVDGLPPQGHDAILQLRQSGFTYDLGELEAQLRRALRLQSAGPIAWRVGQRVLELLAMHRNADCFLLDLEQPAGPH
jgi:hypothetical protein